MPNPINTFGLIGYPLGHSFSKKYFTEKFQKEGILDCQYELFPLEKITDFPSLLQTQNHLVGLNVTIPYKQAVMPYLDELDEAAKAVGAVNTIKINKGKTKGFNTDIYGFEVSLRKMLQAHHQQALILGTGGAAKAVRYVLEQLNIPYQFVSRTTKAQQLTYDTLHESIIHSHTLIINSTPLGMYPNINHCPTIPYEFMGEQHLLYDLVYNPELTLFLKKGQAQGASIKSGLEMLHLQAERAWEIWRMGGWEVGGGWKVERLKG